MNIDQEIVESSLQDSILPQEEEGKKEEILEIISETTSETTSEVITETANSPVWDDLKVFLPAFNEMKDPEEKIRFAIEFMRCRLTGFVSPKFREFWEVRKLCLPFFKDGLSPKTRADLWQQYVDLAVEARRVKEILDERSSFAYEQIDLALQSLVQDLDSVESSLSQIISMEIPSEVRSLAGKKDNYIITQKKLHLFNTLATKVNALRKEVIKTDMRVRSKNKLFEKLSACGDRIFPVRKDLIKMISDDFLEDVNGFFSQYFASGQAPQGSLYALREEVKGLQSIAKVLTLNTYSFTETRLKLSSCWDVLKEWEKEKKKEMSEKRAEYQQNFESNSLKVQEFELFCQQEVSLNEIEAKYVEFVKALREVEMDRVEARMLRERMDLAKKPHEDKKRQHLSDAQEKEKQVEVSRLQKVQELRLSLQSLIENADTLSIDDLSAQKVILEEMHKAIVLSKAEKVLLERLFKQFKDRMLDAKGRSLLALSHDEREQYAGLEQLLEEKKQRRQEVKSQVESYRKILGGSSLDFERAMSYRELMELEKDSLEKINKAISEIESKMEEING
ncbi:MAG: hypothetical protein V4489_01555 [Chlamydiota bacterium]